MEVPVERIAASASKNITCFFKTPQQVPFPALCWSSNPLLCLPCVNSTHSLSLGRYLELSQNLAGFDLW